MAALAEEPVQDAMELENSEDEGKRDGKRENLLRWRRRGRRWRSLASKADDLQGNDEHVGARGVASRRRKWLRYLRESCFLLLMRK